MLSDAQHKTIFDLFEPGGMEAAEREIEQKGWISDGELSLVLERNPDRPLSAPVREFLIERLRGKVRQKAGRKAASDNLEFHIHRSLAAHFYRHFARIYRASDNNKREQARARGDVLPRGEEAAHERALRSVQEMGFFGWLTLGRLNNILFSGEKPRKRQSPRSAKR